MKPRVKPKQRPYLSKACPPRPVDTTKVRNANPPPRASRNPMARGWTARVFTLYGRYCLACPKGKLTRAVQAHHLVPRQRIDTDMRKTREERDALEYDARNGFPICQRCHELHEFPGPDAKRIPFSRIPAAAVEWARDHGYDHVLQPPVYP
jgi:hypothetical protein